MNFIKNEVERTKVKAKLKQVLYTKALELSKLTGCSVFVKVCDPETTNEYFCTHDLKCIYEQSNFHTRDERHVHSDVITTESGVSDNSIVQQQGEDIDEQLRVHQAKTAKDETTGYYGDSDDDYDIDDDYDVASDDGRDEMRKQSRKSKSATKEQKSEAKLPVGKKRKLTRKTKKGVALGDPDKDETKTQRRRKGNAKRGKDIEIRLPTYIVARKLELLKKSKMDVANGDVDEDQAETIHSENKNVGTEKKRKNTKRRKIKKSKMDVASSDVDEETNHSENKNVGTEKKRKGTKRRKMSGKTENVKKEETQKPQWQCIECKEIFNRYLAYAKHLRISLHRKFDAVEDEQHSCNICNEKFNSLANLFIHKKMVHNITALFECQICNKSFNYKNLYEIHIKHHDQHGERRYQCKFCDKILLLPQEYENHMRSHETHECDVCGERFPSQSSLSAHHTAKTCVAPVNHTVFEFKQKKQDHSTGAVVLQTIPKKPEESIRTPHTKNTPDESACPVATSQTIFPEKSDQSQQLKDSPEKSDQSQQLKDSHEKSDQSQQLKGLQEGSGPTTQTSQKEACSERIDTSKQPNRLPALLYGCIHCKKVFTMKQDLNVHLSTHAMQSNRGTNDKSSNLGIAGIEQKTNIHSPGKSQNTNDVKDNIEYRYKCNFCEKTYESKLKRKQHEKKYHRKLYFGPDWKPIKPGPTRPKEFVCEVCDKAYCNQIDLTMHKVIHTSTEKHRQTEVVNVEDLDDSLNVHILRPMKCKICSQIFDNIIELKQHFQEHHSVDGKFKLAYTYVKNYKCDECGKAFCDPGHLERHKQLHSGDLKFPCKVCNKIFLVEHNLTDHMKLHTGAYEHLCAVCGRTFISLGALEIHSRSHIESKEIFICEVCGKGFPRKVNLTLHVTLAHTKNEELREKRRQAAKRRKEKYPSYYKDLGLRSAKKKHVRRKKESKNTKPLRKGQKATEGSTTATDNEVVRVLPVPTVNLQTHKTVDQVFSQFTESESSQYLDSSSSDDE